MKSRNLATILRENFSPVARMRLFSRGVQINNRLQLYDAAWCDKGCLACGNCIDACPVVREKERFEFRQNRRTSMSLENIVGEDCRRCYKCVRACPQVSSDTKEFATGFRRGEKFLHASLATLIFTLMATGIFLYHYKPVIPPFHASFYAFFHILAGVLLIVLPLVYYAMDKKHLPWLIHKAWNFGPEDKQWFENFKAFLQHPFSKALPAWTEFNPYHKAWICYLSVALPILAVTGICNYLGEGVLGKGFYTLAYSIHSLVALCTDLLILTHLYFKLFRFLIRNISDMYKYWRANKNFNYPFMYTQKKITPQQH